MDAFLATIAESPLHLLLGVAVLLTTVFYGVRKTSDLEHGNIPASQLTLGRLLALRPPSPRCAQAPRRFTFREDIHHHNPERQGECPKTIAMLARPVACRASP